MTFVHRLPLYLFPVFVPTGAFLVPYFFILIVVGFPMLLLEMGIGQFASLGPVSIWRFSPLFKGESSVSSPFSDQCPSGTLVNSSKVSHRSVRLSDQCPSGALVHSSKVSHRSVHLSRTSGHLMHQSTLQR